MQTLTSHCKVTMCSVPVMSNSVTPWTLAHLALLFMGSPRKTYWNGLPLKFKKKKKKGIGGLSKADCPPWCGWVLTNQLMAYPRLKGWTPGIKMEYLLLLSWDYFAPAFELKMNHQLFLSLKLVGLWTGTPPGPSDSQVLKLRLKLHH